MTNDSKGTNVLINKDQFRFFKRGLIVKFVMNIVMRFINKLFRGKVGGLYNLCIIIFELTTITIEGGLNSVLIKDIIKFYNF